MVCGLCSKYHSKELSERRLFSFLGWGRWKTAWKLLPGTLTLNILYLSSLSWLGIMVESGRGQQHLRAYALEFAPPASSISIVFVWVRNPWSGSIATLCAPTTIPAWSIQSRMTHNEVYILRLPGLLQLSIGYVFDCWTWFWIHYFFCSLTIKSTDNTLLWPVFETLHQDS